MDFLNLLSSKQPIIPFPLKEGLIKDESKFKSETAKKTIIKWKEDFIKDAIQKGDLKKVKEAVEELGIKINESHDIHKLLMEANDDKTVSIILGIAPGSIIDKWIENAFKTNNMKEISMFHKHGYIDVNQKDKNGNSLLVKAITELQSPEIVKFLLEAGINLNSGILKLAIDKEDKKIATVIIENLISKK